MVVVFSEARVALGRAFALALLALACGTPEPGPGGGAGGQGSGAASGAGGATGGAGAGTGAAGAAGSTGGAAGSGAVSAGGAGGNGASGQAGAGFAGTGGGVSGAAGSGGITRPFWCPGYEEAPSLASWVSIKVVLPEGTSGGMTSPIQACQVGESDWSLTASGEEQDGVDQTTMSFSITGTYEGPGHYMGSMSQGISGSFRSSLRSPVRLGAVLSRQDGSTA